MNDTNLRPLFCRLGGKQRLVKTIINKMPPHEIYIEPFFGGGAVYWKKEPVKKEIINDLDSDIMKWLKYIKKHNIDDSKLPKDLSTIKKLSLFYSKKPANKEQALTKDLIKHCNSFSGRDVRHENDIYNNSNPYNKLKNIDKYKERLKNTIILNEDYIKVIKKYDNKKSLFFLDPPYENSVLYTDTGYAQTAIDYEKMADTLKSLKGKFILTINDSKNMRRIFKNFNIKKIKITSTGKQGYGSQERDELIITNY